MTAVYLVGGPAHGQVIDVTMPAWGAPIQMPHYGNERIDVTTFGDSVPQYVPTYSIANYRRRRWRCGNNVMTTTGEMVFDYIGGA